MSGPAPAVCVVAPMVASKPDTSAYATVRATVTGAAAESALVSDAGSVSARTATCQSTGTSAIARCTIVSALDVANIPMTPIRAVAIAIPPAANSSRIHLRATTPFSQRSVMPLRPRQRHLNEPFAGRCRIRLRLPDSRKQTDGKDDRRDG